MKLTAVLAAALCSAALAPTSLAGQSAADSVAIRAAALDYAEGWYTGDGARMQRALHPDLAKRIVQRGEQETLQQMDAAQLTGMAARGGGRNTPADRQQKDVRILDVFGTTASVRLTMESWIDYMHLAKWDGRWVIVNVLWEMKAR